MTRRLAFIASVIALTWAATSVSPPQEFPEPSPEPEPTVGPSKVRIQWPAVYARVRHCLVRVDGGLQMAACRP